MRRDGDWHYVSSYFWAFVLWRLSLVVFCDSSESQSSSGGNSASVSEQRDRGPFSSVVLATLTLFLLVLLNPAASQAVRPTSSIPALTSRAGMSLSFVFPTPPAASRHPPCTGSQSSLSQSGVSRVLTASPPAPPCRWPSSRQLPRGCSRGSRSQPRSSEHTRAPELHEMLSGARSRLTDSVC